MANFCFEHLGFTSFEQVDRVTIPEFLLMAKAQARKNVEREYCLHKAAWLSAIAKATKKNGKLVYPKFEKFFDRERAMSELEERPEMSERSRKIIEYRKRKKGGTA